MFKIFGLRIRQFKKEYYVYLSMFLVSIFLTAMMGGAFSGVNKSTIYYLYDETSAIQQKLMDGLLEEDLYQYKMVQSQEQGVDALRRADGVLLLDLRNFVELESDSEKIVFLYSVENYDLWQVKRALSSQISLLRKGQGFADSVEQVLAKELSTEEKEQISSKYLDGIHTKKIYEIEVLQKENATGYSNLKHTAIGYSVFFSMFLIIFGVGNISRDRETKVWSRLRTSPLRDTQIIAGTLLFTLIAGCMQMGIYYFSSKYLFGINWGNSNLGVVLVMMSYVFAVSCMGLLIASILRSYAQLSAFSAIFITGTSMLGGTMWPLEIVKNKLVRTLADFTPQRWAVEGLENIAMYGKGLESVTQSVTILVVMGLVFFLLAMISLRLQRGMTR